MTAEATFREAGGLLWLAGLSIEEAEDRIARVNRPELRTAVRAGYVERAAMWSLVNTAMERAGK